VNAALVNERIYRSGHLARWVMLIAFCACRPAANKASHTQDSATTQVIDSVIPPSEEAQAPCSTSATYSLTDTTRWATELEEGERAVLRAGTSVIDTVDLTFGVQPVRGGSLIFLPVKTFAVDSIEASLLSGPPGEPTDHVLCTRTERRALSSRLPYFNSNFSSPVVLDSALIYWGIRAPTGTGPHRLYAVRYDPRTNRVDSLALREEALATDYRYYLAPPLREGNLIAFEGKDSTALVDRAAWRLVRFERRQPPQN
jgi:hypothetical protein